jgi:hypothetical protein
MPPPSTRRRLRRRTDRRSGSRPPALAPASRDWSPPPPPNPSTRRRPCEQACRRPSLWISNTASAPHNLLPFFQPLPPRLLPTAASPPSPGAHPLPIPSPGQIRPRFCGHRLCRRRIRRWLGAASKGKPDARNRDGLGKGVSGDASTQASMSVASLAFRWHLWSSSSPSEPAPQCSVQAGGGRALGVRGGH